MTPEGVEMLNEGAVDNIIAFLEGTPTERGDRLARRWGLFRGNG